MDLILWTLGREGGTFWVSLVLFGIEVKVYAVPRLLRTALRAFEIPSGFKPMSPARLNLFWVRWVVHWGMVDVFRGCQIVSDNLEEEYRS